jgi:hypothetical protein
MNKTSKRKCSLGTCMGNRPNQCFIKFCSTNFKIEQNWLHFYSPILYKKDNGVLGIQKFWVLRVPPIQIPTQNGEIKALFNKFHRTINLMALLLTILGSWNKETNSKLKNIKGSPHTNLHIQYLKIWLSKGVSHKNSH